MRARIPAPELLALWLSKIFWLNPIGLSTPYFISGVKFKIFLNIKITISKKFEMRILTNDSFYMFEIERKVVKRNINTPQHCAQNKRIYFWRLSSNLILEKKQNIINKAASFLSFFYPFLSHSLTGIHSNKLWLKTSRPIYLF